MQVSPYLSLLRHNPAFTRLLLALQTGGVAAAAVLAGFLADAVPAQVAAWTMVTLVALAGAAWFACSRGAVVETCSVDLATEDR